MVKKSTKKKQSSSDNEDDEQFPDYLNQSRSHSHASSKSQQSKQIQKQSKPSKTHSPSGQQSNSCKQISLQSGQQIQRPLIVSHSQSSDNEALQQCPSRCPTTKKGKKSRKMQRRQYSVYNEIDLIKNCFIRYLDDIGLKSGLVFGVKDRARLRKEQMLENWDALQFHQTLPEDHHQSQLSIYDVLVLNPVCQQWSIASNEDSIRDQIRQYQPQPIPQIPQSDQPLSLPSLPSVSVSVPSVSLCTPPAPQTAPQKKITHLNLIKTNWDPQHTWHPSEQLCKIKETIKNQNIPASEISDSLYIYFLDIADIFPREITAEIYTLLSRLYLLVVGAPAGGLIGDVVREWVNGEYFLTRRFSRIYYKPDLEVEGHFTKLCEQVIRLIGLLRRKQRFKQISKQIHTLIT